MTNAKFMNNPVFNAMTLYAETGGLTIAEVAQRFADNEQCRENIYLLVAMQANTLPYAQQVNKETP